MWMVTSAFLAVIHISLKHYLHTQCSVLVILSGKWGKHDVMLMVGSVKLIGGYFGKALYCKFMFCIQVLEGSGL